MTDNTLAAIHCQLDEIRAEIRSSRDRFSVRVEPAYDYGPTNVPIYVAIFDELCIERDKALRERDQLAQELAELRRATTSSTIIKTLNAA